MQLHEQKEQPTAHLAFTGDPILLETFYQLCRKHGVTPKEVVLEQIQEKVKEWSREKEEAEA